MAKIKIYEPPSLLGLAKLFTRVATTTIFHILTYPFRSTRASSLRKHALNTAIRTLLTHITVPQSRHLNPSTTQRYLTFCHSHSQSSQTLSVPYKASQNEKADAHAHWIGDPSADVVILYFHGGAFFQPATAGTFLYLQDLLRKLGARRKGKSVAALVLAYSLAPEAAFPTQLREGAAVLRELLHPFDPASKRRIPGDVFLAGDSAGGNIALGLVSHLLRPHAEVERVVLDGALGGLMLFSPSVSHGVGWGSMRGNAECDMLPASKVPVWGAMYLGRTDSLQTSMDGLRLETDAYSEPCVAEPSWWQGLSRVVGYVLVLSGGDEVFVDSINQLGEEMKEGWREGGGEEGSVMFVKTLGESHIGPIVEFMMSGGKRTSGSQSLIDEWWAARLEPR